VLYCSQIETRAQSYRWSSSVYVIIAACIVILAYAVLRWVRAPKADAFRVQERLLGGLLVLAILAVGAFVSVLLWNQIP
jgi:uncharacterized membrane protein YidH (DUF202 family)